MRIWLIVLGLLLSATAAIALTAGDGKVCHSGQILVCADPPGGRVVTPSGQLCAVGQIIDDNGQCQSPSISCPPTQHAQGGQCMCQAGYTKAGNSCCSPSQQIVGGQCYTPPDPKPDSPLCHMSTREICLQPRYCGRQVDICGRAVTCAPCGQNGG